MATLPRACGGAEGGAFAEATWGRLPDRPVEAGCGSSWRARCRESDAGLDWSPGWRPYVGNLCPNEHFCLPCGLRLCYSIRVSDVAHPPIGFEGCFRVRLVPPVAGGDCHCGFGGAGRGGDSADGGGEVALFSIAGAGAGRADAGCFAADRADEGPGRFALRERSGGDIFEFIARCSRGAVSPERTEPRSVSPALCRAGAGDDAWVYRRPSPVEGQCDCGR